MPVLRVKLHPFHAGDRTMLVDAPTWAVLLRLLRRRGLLSETVEQPKLWAVLQKDAPMIVLDEVLYDFVLDGADVYVDRDGITANVPQVETTTSVVQWVCGKVFGFLGQRRSAASNEDADDGLDDDFEMASMFTDSSDDMDMDISTRKTAGVSSPPPPPPPPPPLIMTASCPELRAKPTKPEMSTAGPPKVFLTELTAAVHRRRTGSASSMDSIASSFVDAGVEEVYESPKRPAVKLQTGAFGISQETLATQLQRLLPVKRAKWEPKVSDDPFIRALEARRLALVKGDDDLEDLTVQYPSLNPFMEASQW